jgi:exodeoxyribonuclease VII small subunit
MTKFQEYDALSFEDAMAELERIVAGLDSGDGTLEDSIDLYQRGVYLSSLCTTRLNDIEKRVMILTNPENSDAESNFSTEPGKEDEDN